MTTRCPFSGGTCSSWLRSRQCWVGPMDFSLSIGGSLRMRVKFLCWSLISILEGFITKLIRCPNTGEGWERGGGGNANHRHCRSHWQVLVWPWSSDDQGYNHLMIIWGHWHIDHHLMIWSDEDNIIIGRERWVSRQCYGEFLTGTCLSSSLTLTRPSRTQRLGICWTRLSSLSSTRWKC